MLPTIYYTMYYFCRIDESTRGNGAANTHMPVAVVILIVVLNCKLQCKRLVSQAIGSALRLFSILYVTNVSMSNTRIGMLVSAAVLLLVHIGCFKIIKICQIVLCFYLKRKAAKFKSIIEVSYFKLRGT